MIQPRVFGKETVEHRAQQENAGALEGFFVDRYCNFYAARSPDPAALAYAAHDRPAVDAANAADATLGDAVRQFAEHRQHFAERRGVVTRATINKAEVIGAEHVDETPSHRPGVRHFAATAQLRNDRLARRSRT